MVASHVPPIGDLTHNPGRCADWDLNQLPFGLQAGATPARAYIFLTREKCLSFMSINLREKLLLVIYQHLTTLEDRIM